MSGSDNCGDMREREGRRSCGDDGPMLVFTGKPFIPMTSEEQTRFEAGVAAATARYTAWRREVCADMEARGVWCRLAREKQEREGR